MYNPWENRQERTARIKREVMTHFAYFKMYELCDDELYSKACAVLKAKKMSITFWALTKTMKEIWRNENEI